MSKETSIIVERVGAVCKLTLNDPASMNAIDLYTMKHLGTVLYDVGLDPNISVLVIQGNGRSFCSGKNMKLPPSTTSMEEKMQRNRAIAKPISLLREIPQPVIAAVHGYAVGAGLAIAAAADLRFVSPEVKFMAPFNQIGMTPGDLGLSYYLPRLIGHGRAADIFYRSRSFGAEESLSWGFASEIAEDVHQKAFDVAVELAELPAESLRQTKELLEASFSATNLRDHLLLEFRSQVISAETQAHQAAMEAFRN